ncbi:MAG: helix-turn-helix transcriptional regulator [Chloroflexi bacterium]|nr:helix-turn-helix transcriptional regulator [Chloroflexota bacterium]
MIHIHLTPDALLKTRFTYSPLIETMISFRYLTLNKGTPIHRRWADGARRTLEQLELPLMRGLVAGRSCIPDFLTPTPTHLETGSEPDFERVLNTPHEEVAADLAYLCKASGETEMRLTVRAHPSEYLPALVDELRQYWGLVLAPMWPSLLAIVEGDILYRARLLALEGNHRLLNDLSPMASFDGSALRLNKAYGKSDSHHVIDGEGLHLVPSVFTLDDTMWQIVPQYKPMVIYGARGVGSHVAPPDLDDTLELIMGGARASVLQGLEDTPATTTELAHHLHLTAGAVSQHLTLLHRAGLVNPQRSGKRVYYQISNKGAELLRLFR